MPLHDILPPIEMIDYTFLYIVGFVLLVLFMLVVKRLYKTEKKDALYYLHILEACDFKDAKKTALQFSYYGKRIFTDTPTKEIFIKLQQKLTPYKYIQNTIALPPHLEESIKELLRQVREHHA